MIAEGGLGGIPLGLGQPRRHHLRPGVQQLPDHRLAQAAGAAGDDCDAAEPARLCHESDPADDLIDDEP